MHIKLIRNFLVVFTVLLVFTGAAFVSSATEVNTEPWAVDLSASSSTRYVFDPENNHTDSYIVTGSNPDAEITVRGSCNITLRNATLRRIEVDYSDTYDINITIEGTNTIDQYNWASQGALEIYSSNVTISGGENDSLYANSKAFTAYSLSHNLGVVTVEGGNITFRSFGGGAPFQTNYIQNGGNVTVIEEDYSESFLYDVQLNGGSLEVINKRASSGAVFIGDVKLKNGVSLKVSVPNTPYLVSGLIGLADDVATDDCMFVRFDNSSDFVYLNDDNNVLAGKSYFEIKVVDHAHICENGICYCGFICEHDTDGGTCGICGKYIYKIIHHPTETEPFVTLNDGANASYQWYKLNGISEITDESDILSWQYLGAPFPDSYSYNKKDGWTGITYGYEEEYEEQYIYYFVRHFNAGEKIMLEFSSPVLYAEMFSDEDYIDFEFIGNTAIGIAENAGIYGLCAVTDGSEPTVKAYVLNGEKTIITDETGARINNPQYGSYYICEVTANDGTLLTSFILDYSYKITHQPTETETYVDLNDPTGASYQWYRVTGENEYITEENSVSFEILGAPPEIGGTYSEGIGWTPDEYGYYFVVALNQGQVLTLNFAEIPLEIYCLYSSVENDIEDEFYVYSGTITAQADGYYAICAESTATLEAYIDNIRIDAVNGQTDKKLTLNEKGKFLCDVTFKDGTTEKSDIVEMKHIHTGGTATCNASAVCEICSQPYGSINADAHKWNSGAITTTATCKIEGVKTYTCQHDSKHTYTEKLGLNASNHKNTKNVSEVKATCSTVGYTAGVYCNDCAKYISGHKETPKNTSNHVNTKTVPETPATLDKVGYTEGVYCNDCEKYISGHKEIPVTVNLGDVDGDGKISAADARLALRASVGLENLSDLQEEAADIDSDKKISAADARMILRASVGLEKLDAFKKD